MKLHSSSRLGRRDIMSFGLRELLPHKVSYDQEHIDAAIQWIIGAFDESSGLVRPAYDLRSGWRPAEVSGSAVVVPTLLHYAELDDSPEVLEHVAVLAPALINSQQADGSYVSGAGRSSPLVTADALLALLAINRLDDGDPIAAKSAVGAADWLVGRSDTALPVLLGAAFSGRIVWALARAGELLDNADYRRAAVELLSGVRMTWERDRWLDGSDSWRGLGVRDLAATIDGLVEASAILGDESALSLGLDMLVELERAYRREGSGVHLRWRHHLAESISSRWRGSSRSAFMEGSALVALCAFRAARLGAEGPSRIRRFGDEILDAARSAQALGGVDRQLYGAVAASAPVWAGRTAFQLSVPATAALATALLERRDGGLPVERLG